MPTSLTLRLLPDTLAVCHLEPDAAMPWWATVAPFFSVTRTTEELSVICAASRVPRGTSATYDWRALQLHGRFHHSLFGLMDAISTPLAGAEIYEPEGDNVTTTIEVVDAPTHSCPGAVSIRVASTGPFTPTNAVLGRDLAPGNDHFVWSFWVHRVSTDDPDWLAPTAIITGSNAIRTGTVNAMSSARFLARLARLSGPRETTTVVTPLS